MISAYSNTLTLLDIPRNEKGREEKIRKKNETLFTAAFL